MKRFLLLTFAAGLGCAAEFDPQSEVDSLRVFAVQKDKPYARPGDAVTLSMLWHDGAKKPSSQVQVLWAAGCFNPPGDLFTGCFSDLGGGDLDSGLCDPTADATVCLGNDFTFSIPSDIISRRPRPQVPDQPPYGLAYVFFAACGGFLGPAPRTEELSFPLGCYEDSGLTRPLGSKHFVAGYTAIYVYDEITNANPVIEGFEFNGVRVAPLCIGADCLDVIGAKPQPVDCQAGNVPCIFACPGDGDEDCPGYDVKPIVSRASAESDPLSSAIEHRSVQEQMWVNYYVDGGSVESDVRLLNDARIGWNDDYGTEFRAPKKTGPMNLWAVVHDSRGGVDWARVRLWVN